MVVSRQGLAHVVAFTAAVEMRPDPVASTEALRPITDRPPAAAVTAEARAREERRAMMQRFRS